MRYTPYIELDPADPVVAGSMQTWTLTFTAGHGGIQPGGGIRITTDLRSGISRLQTDKPGEAGYVTSASSADVALKHYTATVMHPLSADLAVTRNRQMSTNVYVVDVIVAGSAALPEGETITVVIGDRTAGGPGCVAPTLAGEHRFWVFVKDGQTVSSAALLNEVHFQSAKATGILAEGPFQHMSGNPAIQVLPGPVTGMTAALPPQIEPDADTPVHVVRYDEFDNPVRIDRVPVQVSDKGIVSPGGDLAVTAAPGGANGRYLAVQVAEAAGALTARSNAGRLASAGDGEYRVFFGDIHGHTLVSDGSWGDPDDYFRYGREVAGLDFCALTDHDFGVAYRGTGAWESVQRAVARHHDPGRFVTLLAYESTHCIRAGSGIKAGHKNIYFPGDTGCMVNTSPYFGSERNEIHGRTLEELYAGLEDSGAIVANHQNVNTDWSFSHPMLRLVEIYSKWGCSEYPDCPDQVRNMKPESAVHSGLARGHQVGFVAGSDTHIAQPANRTEADPATRSVPRPGGLTAVLATELTREAVFEAMMSRRTYATTGARILLEVTANDQPMGHTFDAVPDSVALRVTAVGADTVKTVSVIKNNEDVHEEHSDGDRVSFEWRDSDPAPGDYYYVRAEQQDGHRAWSSPVWTSPAEVR